MPLASMKVEIKLLEEMTVTERYPLSSARKLRQLPGNDTKPGVKPIECLG
jgi:hypothetical protein